MRDLTSPLLSQRTVAGLAGVSQATIRRWERAGIVAGSRRRSAPRLYSWREVERLQRAAYLVKTERIPVAEVKRFLNNGVSVIRDVDWIRARSAPRPRRRPGEGGGSRGRRARRGRR